MIPMVQSPNWGPAFKWIGLEQASFHFVERGYDRGGQQGPAAVSVQWGQSGRLHPAILQDTVKGRCCKNGIEAVRRQRKLKLCRWWPSRTSERTLTLCSEWVLEPRNGRGCLVPICWGETGYWRHLLMSVSCWVVDLRLHLSDCYTMLFPVMILVKMIIF